MLIGFVGCRDGDERVILPMSKKKWCIRIGVRDFGGKHEARQANNAS
jgi:hypothetical protein